MKNSIFIFIIFTALYGCSGHMPDTKFVVNLENEDFRIYLNEEVKEDTLSLLKLHVSTLNGGYCQEDKLIAASLFNGEELSFRIHHIDRSEECSTPAYNPSRNLIAGYLEEGTYPVQFSISQSIHYTGELSVSENTYHLNFNESPNLFIHPHVTNSIPTGAIWFRLSYLERKSKIAFECLDSIQKFSKELDLPEGYYSYFELEGKEIQLTSENPYYYLENEERLIILKDTSSTTLDSIYQIFRSYSKKAGHQFYVNLKTWNADEFTID